MKLYVVEAYSRDYGWIDRLVVAPTSEVAKSDVESMGFENITASEIIPSGMLRSNVYEMPRQVFRTR